MDAKQDFTDWREMLGYLIRSSAEKKRLAHEADIKPITLERWAEGTSQPREENLLRLARALPTEISVHFLRLVESAIPALAHTNAGYTPVVAEISSELYEKVLQAHAQMSTVLAGPHLQKLILHHALLHLDHGRVGMTVTIICCVTPRQDQKVRALRQIGGVGSSPWDKDQEKQIIFLGAESVAGHAVATYRTFGAENRADTPFASGNWDKHEESAVAAPILRQAKIAGALVASSAQPYYFTREHQSLLELYAQLIALIFSPSDFYDVSAIELGRMPKIELQKPYCTDIERRVGQKHKDLQATHNPINTQLARIYVWQDIVDELLLLPPQE